MDVGTNPDDDLDSGLVGVARSLDTANAQDIIVLDVVEDPPLPDIDVGASEAAPKKKTIAAKENVRTRMRTSAQVREKHRRLYDVDKHLVLTPLPAEQGAAIKSVFLPSIKHSEDALPLWPQFDAAWRGADFGVRTFVHGKD